MSLYSYILFQCVRECYNMHTYLIKSPIPDHLGSRRNTYVEGSQIYLVFFLEAIEVQK